MFGAVYKQSVGRGQCENSSYDMFGAVCKQSVGRGQYEDSSYNMFSVMYKQSVGRKCGFRLYLFVVFLLCLLFVLTVCSLLYLVPHILFCMHVFHWIVFTLQCSFFHFHLCPIFFLHICVVLFQAYYYVLTVALTLSWHNDLVVVTDFVECCG